MSKLRPTLNSGSAKPCMTNGTAYLMILNAVEQAPGLIHGKLRDGQNYCAIGHYFERNDTTSLPESLIDEVAAVNDSMPNLTMRQRKVRVARWLRWKLTVLGMPGFATKKA
jgi:hypothetical protein